MIMGRVIASRFGPWLIGAVLVVAASGWAFAGVQTIRYMSSQNDLEATVNQVVIDANQAADEVIADLERRHTAEMGEVLATLNRHRVITAEARSEKQRLAVQLAAFEHELELLNNEPETRDYLSEPVPDSVRERLLNAQRRHQAESGGGNPVADSGDT